MNRNSVVCLLCCGLLGITLIGNGCGGKEEGKVSMPARDINTVMEAHTQSLMAIEGVVGVAISENEEKEPCIMVLVIEASEEMLQKLPKELEGHPVCPFESGEIKPQSGN